jgi:N4-gp56 family major capsid protein
LGGYLSAPELSQKLRVIAQPLKRFRAFTSPLGAGGAHRNANVFFDKVGNVSAAGGTLVETNTIVETTVLIKQGTATITEYGNAIAYTGKLISLSQLSPEDSISIALRNDAAKILDTAAGLQFTSAEQVAVQSASGNVVFTTNGSATATATANLSGTNVRLIVDNMRKRNIPFVDGSNYVCITAVGGYAGFFNDTATGGFVDVAKYTDLLAQNLFRGEIGKYYMTRIVEETNFLLNTVGSGAAMSQAVIFGDDAVKEVIAVPEELREKIPTDYGRSQGLAWYGLLGFQRIWSQSVDSQENIVFVTSA